MPEMTRRERILAASRKQMDIIGFALLATLTGLGGGTVRDLILDRPVFWLLDQTYLAICLGVAILCFFAAHLVPVSYTHLTLPTILLV